ncbi:Co/Zn/Cd efflux system membrane fusion protein [Desulfocucumis palustris]|uniref:Co/Zn/Cd efflux system membrane fusion protein n=1 Tax=Desulfocucumis palustris TaxID=1898651 RepID=A0A2L2XB31_9FIRM|nr:efflux RND transporter periplasmic adaptor subunit [Desulfocucumis palustris]GBF33499.1 Co/Zn/Cd efflux system membrane fusion protein [Desulfocucumis palustris]
MNKEKSVPVVTVEEIRQSDTAYNLQTTGMVEPGEEAKLSFQVAGKIIEGPAEEGSVVTAGQILARLDESDYQAQMEAARYQLELATVEMDRCKLDLERYEKLFTSNAISQKTLEDAQLAFRAAQAKAGQAGSSLKQAELMVKHCVLTSTFQGKVLKKTANRGEMVDAGTPVLVLAQLNPVKVVVTAPANQIENWAEGADAWISTGGIPVSTNTGDTDKIKVKIHKVSPGAEGQTGSFRVELKAENPGQVLRPGEVVNVERRVRTRTGLWIPLKSVVSRGEDLEYVFVLAPSGTVVRQQAIKLGTVAGDRIEVVSGLEPGARIAVLMPEDLRDGDTVEVK